MQRGCVDNMLRHLLLGILHCSNFAGTNEGRPRRSATPRSDGRPAQAAFALAAASVFSASLLTNSSPE